MTTPPVINPSDPRVQAVLAALRGPQQVPQIPAPQMPNVDPAAPNVQIAPPTQPPQMAAPAVPAAAPAQPQPGPLKRFLSGLVSNLGGAVSEGFEGAKQRLGLPTEYSKSQDAAKLALQQQAQDSLERYRDAEGARQDAQTAQINSGLADYTIPKDPRYGSVAGTVLPRSVAVPLMQRLDALANAKDIAGGKNASAEKIAAGHDATTLAGKQLQYGPGSYLRRAVRSIGGRIISYDKGDPDNKALQKDLGADTAMITGPRNADARARANARYRTFDTVDAEGNPVTISGLDALTGGAAHTPYTQAKGLKSDLVGIQQYDSILGRISSNLGVLNDNTQRVAIAHTLSEADKNPGAFQALVTSALQEGALTPQGAQLAADIMQGKEFGGVARKYGGNMNGTEGLMNRIISNQASPVNSEQLNRDLVANDRAFTAKANTVVSGLTRHNAGAKGGPPNVTPQPSSAAPAGADGQVRGHDGKLYWANSKTRQILGEVSQ